MALISCGEKRGVAKFSILLGGHPHVALKGPACWQPKLGIHFPRHRQPAVLFRESREGFFDFPLGPYLSLIHI